MYLTLREGGEFYFMNNVKSLKIEKEEYINKTFRLNKKLVKEMEEICKDKGISLNKFIDISIRFALENLDRNDES